VLPCGGGTPRELSGRCAYVCPSRVEGTSPRCSPDGIGARFPRCLVLRAGATAAKGVGHGESGGVARAGGDAGRLFERDSEGRSAGRRDGGHLVRGAPAGTPGTPVSVPGAWPWPKDEIWADAQPLVDNEGHVLQRVRKQLQTTFERVEPRRSTSRVHHSSRRADSAVLARLGIPGRGGAGRTTTTVVRLAPLRTRRRHPRNAHEGREPPGRARPRVEV
jgi:hypothetical protein